MLSSYIEKQHEKTRKKKQQYLIDHILNRQYDPEDFSDFLLQEREEGQEIDNWTIEELETQVTLFKRSLPSRTEQDDLSFKLQTIELNNTDGRLYANRLKTAKKKKTVLTEKDVFISVDKVELKSGGLFFGKSLEFTLSSHELNLNIKRTEAEFGWLLDYLGRENPFTPLPPLRKYTESSDEIIMLENAKDCYERFLNDCLNHPRLRSSLVLEVFIVSPTKEELEKRVKDIQIFFENSFLIEKAMIKKNFDSLNADVLQLYPTENGQADLKISSGLRSHIQATEGQYRRFISLFEQLEKLQKEATFFRKKLASVNVKIKTTFMELQRVALQANAAKPNRSTSGLVEDAVFSSISAFYDNNGLLIRKGCSEETGYDR